VFCCKSFESGSELLLWTVLPWKDYSIFNSQRVTCKCGCSPYSQGVYREEGGGGEGAAKGNWPLRSAAMTPPQKESYVPLGCGNDRRLVISSHGHCYHQSPQLVESTNLWTPCYPPPPAPLTNSHSLRIGARTIGNSFQRATQLLQLNSL